ncbi:hypothetical protein PPACK8108_LOCUS17247 [Phakopsora pachyrhizi]|uniref:Uncharacterized protein n=1 Tax=Phakopsora pachyrhizi TaxID=170000 RepID=A0AAV0BBN8_PHAPC|nr:hypothetical protein PPACK8108_LOCUS17247 [Phakopsora pachyrhizi]
MAMDTYRMMSSINHSLAHSVEYLHVCCREHQEIRTKAAEYVRVKIVEAVHGQAKVARRVEVWMGRVYPADGLSVGPASVNTGEGACNQKDGKDRNWEHLREPPRMDMGVGGSEYGAVAKLRVSEPGDLPPSVLEQGSNWYHRGKEPGVHGPGRRLGPRVGRARAARVPNKGGDQKQETEASIGGWRFLQGVLVVYGPNRSDSRGI